MVPRELRQEFLRLCHDVPAAGHQGIDRTDARLIIKDRFCWYRMLSDTEKYVSTCRPSSSNKRPQRHARAEMLKYRSGAPMERVHLDFWDPCPVLQGVMSTSWNWWTSSPSGWNASPLPSQRLRLPPWRRLLISSLVSGAPFRFLLTSEGISRSSFSAPCRIENLVGKWGNSHRLLFLSVCLSLSLSLSLLHWTHGGQSSVSPDRAGPPGSAWDGG